MYRRKKFTPTPRTDPPTIAALAHPNLGLPHPHPPPLHPPCGALAIVLNDATFPRPWCCPAGPPPPPPPAGAAAAPALPPPPVAWASSQSGSARVAK
mmetsp:Transcript_19949/g.49559  ORF Transcript_19949/g.49559 Transcript_19949/m.49559 type:complete len:97 (+) Transcript_19949:297-587(+)